MYDRNTTADTGTIVGQIANCSGIDTVEQEHEHEQDAKFSPLHSFHLLFGEAFRGVASSGLLAFRFWLATVAL